jgi:NAD(P)-dependent dehydrogenase (short-subunit alcohol dehydrogenase family)
MKTVMITGCSSGFGLETARLFLDLGWQVVATMRRPDAGLFPPNPNLRVVALDVTDDASIAAAVQAAGPLDALVNNAGIGWLNAVEGTPLATVRDLFETNTIGTIAMTQAVLPQMREQGAGVIVNVTSSVTLAVYPLLASYTASKAAVNAFSETLAPEVEPFGLRVRIVLPGRAPDTRFGDNARARMEGGPGFPPAYMPQVQAIMGNWAQDRGPVTTAGDVARAVWRAVTDPAAPMRIAAGADAEALMPAA